MGIHRKDKYLSDGFIRHWDELDEQAMMEGKHLRTPTSCTRRLDRAYSIRQCLQDDRVWEKMLRDISREEKESNNTLYL